MAAWEEDCRKSLLLHLVLGKWGFEGLRPHQVMRLLTQCHSKAMTRFPRHPHQCPLHSPNHPSYWHLSFQGGVSVCV
jgi:hypothetical protein